MPTSAVCGKPLLESGASMGAVTVRRLPEKGISDTVVRVEVFGQ